MSSYNAAQTLMSLKSETKQCVSEGTPSRLLQGQLTGRHPFAVTGHTSSSHTHRERVMSRAPLSLLQDEPMAQDSRRQQGLMMRRRKQEKKKKTSVGRVSRQHRLAPSFPPSFAGGHEGAQPLWKPWPAAPSSVRHLAVGFLVDALTGRPARL